MSRHLEDNFRGLGDKKEICNFTTVVSNLAPCSGQPPKVYILKETKKREGNLRRSLVSRRTEMRQTGVGMTWHQLFFLDEVLHSLMRQSTATSIYIDGGSRLPVKGGRVPFG